jgi:AcrR family transcriptional regulator
MAKATKAKPERAADKIKATASDLFYREGIRAVGVDEIVTRAGVTKPSLYRAYSSKDELAADCLRDYDWRFWGRFEEATAAHPGDPRAQLRTWFEGLASRATVDGYRGCGLTNAAIEFPDRDNPARKVAFGNKSALRARLRELARAIGARDADGLGDGLLLLMEGAYASGQVFGAGGPARALPRAAEALIEAYAR